jgi:glutamine synthetase
MVGSSASIADANTVLNTIVADVLAEFADALENSDDFTQALNALIRKTFQTHKRIIFNGNNYTDEWVEEARRRGLFNFKHTADALPYFVHEENIALFERHHVLTPVEVHSRYEIMMEGYIKTLNIEALTMLEIARKSILPAASGYLRELIDGLAAKRLVEGLTVEPESSIIKKLAALNADFYQKILELEEKLGVESADTTEHGKYYSAIVFPAMQALRAVADDLEVWTAKDYWPFPTYGDLLFSV